MVQHGELIGLFIIAKMEGEYTDVHYTYSNEEIALAQGTARLAALVIAQVRLLEEWAATRATEQALQEINRRYDAFISIASHELKTPLTTIKGNVELTLRRLMKLNHNLSAAQLDQLRKPLETALQRAQVQARMIEELLEASRIRMNKFTLSMTPYDLADIVEEATKDMQQAVTDRAIILAPVERPVPVQADIDRIKQVILNYLTNALKYSNPEYPVVVHLTREDGFARVSVQDQGPGIPLEAQKSLWQRFYRVPGIEVRHGSGTGLGLGLYICREFIELHHGHVGVQSTPGEGSTFWFTLPIKETA
ncbi:sensor histidine kinase [Ktedonospora formicarum]|uniref:histidine kinase n=1 Tax=Ktedonospora formicarum TaxID=2778364 RepID=A0A8J3I642_9CHLR|nr:HAMP domain-containing sensor histidine kinase [Ktedonospora formicarum]GHO51032.1 hypothetical protein KSX_91950 [Ktedonospora formicarum]